MNKKRKKVSRHRGTHTHGRGAKKKARGKGHRGGIGMAGTGKRADQKKTLVIGKGRKYFGKSKTLRRGKAPKKLESINFDKISKNLQSFIKKGLAKESKGTFEINLKGYKILSGGKVDKKLVIKASAASKSALDKIKKAGGDIIIE